MSDTPTGAERHLAAKRADPEYEWYYQKAKAEVAGELLRLRAAVDGRMQHDAYAEGVAAERARWQSAVKGVRSWYPLDVFPDSGSSPDAKAARTARSTCDNVLRIAGGDDDE